MHTTTGQLDLSQHLTIVIPALNEALTITDIIHQCKDISDDIVVIDGNFPGRNGGYCPPGRCKNRSRSRPGQRRSHPDRHPPSAKGNHRIY